LKQLQLVVWTVLVISGWLAIVATRIWLDVPDAEGPLNVEIPTEVLVLLGISAGSLVTATQIDSDHDRAGRLYIARTGDNPSWMDLWHGDQEGDHEYIDIAKFQMFWFTVAAVVAYGLQINAVIGDAMLANAFTNLTTLPVPDTSLVGLLAVSHLGYLANKLPERK